MEATTVSFCVQYYFCRLFPFFLFFVSSFYIIAFCFTYIFFDLRFVVLLTDSIVSLKNFFLLLCVVHYIVRLSISSFGFLSWQFACIFLSFFFFWSKTLDFLSRTSFISFHLELTVKCLVFFIFHPCFFH